MQMYRGRVAIAADVILWFKTATRCATACTGRILSGAVTHMTTNE